VLTEHYCTLIIEKDNLFIHNSIFRTILIWSAKEPAMPIKQKESMGLIDIFRVKRCAQFVTFSCGGMASIVRAATMY